MTFLRLHSDILDRLRSVLKARPEITFLFLAALVVRLGYLILMLSQLTNDQITQLAPDTIRYVGLGKQMLLLHVEDESAVLLFGPGYSAFLAIFFGIFGAAALPVLLAQIILSSISCALIYLLAVELTGSRPVGFIAGLLSALSFTSVSLANFLLSDSLFFFLFSLANLSFLMGLRSGRSRSIVLSGLCLGAAILTRTIGQFWPLVMILFAFLLPRSPIEAGLFMSRQSRLRACLAPIIALSIVAIWAGRNASIHGIFSPATSSAGGPATIAALTLSAEEGRNVDKIREEWNEQYRQKRGIGELSFGDTYRVRRDAAREVFRKYPGAMIAQYIRLVGENVNQINELYRVQLPSQAPGILAVMNWVKARSLNFLPFWVSLGGFLTMILYHRWRAFGFLSFTYLYFAAMVGFSQWQGSRLFFPGQIASSMAIAFLIVTAATLMKAGYGRITGR